MNELQKTTLLCTKMVARVKSCQSGGRKSPLNSKRLTMYETEYES